LNISIIQSYSISIVFNSSMFYSPLPNKKSHENHTFYCKAGLMPVEKIMGMYMGMGSLSMIMDMLMDKIYLQ